MVHSLLFTARTGAKTRHVHYSNTGTLFYLTSVVHHFLSPCLSHECKCIDSDPLHIAALSDVLDWLVPRGFVVIDVTSCRGCGDEPTQMDVLFQQLVLQCFCCA
jgi:hypothetical protein